MSKIAENVARIVERVGDACRQAGRDPSEVKILAAAKYTDRVGVEELIRAGIFMIGENRVQDAVAKLCADDRTGQVDIHNAFPHVKIHFIGHLQTNKINHALKLFDVIETVDRISLADQLEKRLAEQNRILPVLLEVKLTEEDTKTGCPESEIPNLLDHIRTNCQHLELKGFMGMGPWNPDPEVARPYYKKLRECFERFSHHAPVKGIFDTVSMGMSADFHVAIQEGATVVRIGRALFE